MGTLLPDLHPEAGLTFAPLGSWSSISPLSLLGFIYGHGVYQFTLHETLSKMKNNVKLQYVRFGFIECLTTTFLLTHPWLNWIDEDY